MTCYVARIVGPAGHETFLGRGKLFDDYRKGTVYSSPSAAERALTAWRKEHPRQAVVLGILPLRELGSVLP